MRRSPMVMGAVVAALLLATVPTSTAQASKSVAVDVHDLRDDL